MTEANRVFTKVFLSLTNTWKDTYSFRKIVGAGLSDAERRVRADAEQLLFHYLSDPANDEIFLDKQKFLENAGGPRELARKLADQEIQAFQGSVDAASIVFIHSGLDGATHDLIRAIRLARPDAFYSFVDGQQERIKVAREKGLDAVIEEKISSFVETVSRESLVKKTDRVFQLCGPGKEYLRQGYQFDRDRLGALDDLRHAIVHGDRKRLPVPDITGTIEFMYQTGLFLFGMVNHRYDLRIDSNYFQT